MKIEVLQRYRYLDRATVWEITSIAYNRTGKEKIVSLRDNKDSSRECVGYSLADFENLVKEGKFKLVSSNNNLKRSQLLNFINSMYTLGQMDWGRIGGSVTRTEEELETMFNQFVKENV